VRFQRENGSYTVEDLGSTNGTFLNDERIVEPRILSNGDHVRLGPEVVLLVSFALASTIHIEEMGGDTPLAVSAPRPEVV